jgi:hypothetical protein
MIWVQAQTAGKIYGWPTAQFIWATLKSVPMPHRWYLQTQQVVKLCWQVPQLGITGATVSASGNITGGNVLTGGVVSATGNITGSFILGNGSQLTGIDATSIQSGTSNVRVVSSGGNVATGVGGTSNVVVVATTGQFVSVSVATLLATVLTATTHTGTSQCKYGGNLRTGGLCATGGIVLP